MRYLAAGLLGFVAGWSVGCFAWAPIADFWERGYRHHKDRSDYLTQGAIDRGYLDLCERGGALGAWFVDECD